MSKKRVFSTNNDNNYNDYNKIKSGCEILKAVKQNNNNAVLDKFVNYNHYFTLSKAYYKFVGLNRCELYPTQNLYNTNTSYIIHNENIYLKQGSNGYYDNDCENIKQVLYPYGVYNSNKIYNEYFPSKLCLDKWCLNDVNCDKNILDDLVIDCKNCFTPINNNTPIEPKVEQMSYIYTNDNYNNEKYNEQIYNEKKYNEKYSENIKKGRYLFI